MPDSSSKRKKRSVKVIPLAQPIVDLGPFIDEVGDTLFEQPLVDGGKNPAAVARGRSVGLKGGKAKARAAKLGKAKLSAIAKKAERSHWTKKG